MTLPFSRLSHLLQFGFKMARQRRILSRHREFITQRLSLWVDSPFSSMNHNHNICVNSGYIVVLQTTRPKPVLKGLPCEVGRMGSLLKQGEEYTYVVS